MLAAVTSPIIFETMMGMLLISMPYNIQIIPPGIKIQYVLGAISPALLLRKIFHACGNPDNAITPPDIVANSAKIVIVFVVDYILFMSIYAFSIVIDIPMIILVSFISAAYDYFVSCFSFISFLRKSEKLMVATPIT